MEGKDLEYESATGATLEHLRSVAEYERYMTPEVEALIGSLETALRDDNEANLRLYRAELSDLIEDAIILRSHHSRGVSEHKLATDKTLARALEALGDEALYREILTTRDTERK